MDRRTNLFDWPEEDGEFDVDEDFSFLPQESQGLEYGPVSAAETFGHHQGYLNPSVLTLPHHPTSSTGATFVPTPPALNVSDIFQSDQTAPGFYQPNYIPQWPQTETERAFWMPNLQPQSAYEAQEPLDATEAQSSDPILPAAGPALEESKAEPSPRPEKRKRPMRLDRKRRRALRRLETRKNRVILPAGKVEESLSRKAERERQLRDAQSEAEGVMGWGWKHRGDDVLGPTFGETREIKPLYDESSMHVTADLHATFDLSRIHNGKVSDDGGPTVHELQKRNIFRIKDMAYNLDSTSGDAEYLTLWDNNIQKPIYRMFLKLVGRKSRGESMDDSETPLESRGKARQFKPAREVEVFEELKYQKIDNDFRCTDAVRYGDPSTLPDSHSATHLEFKHATAGNKTTGYWRLETQTYYRLALQLWAYTGDSAGCSPQDLGESKDLHLVAETKTNQLIVRGRPPGGREAEKIKASMKPSQKSKQSSKSKNHTATAKKRRIIKSDSEESDEDAWLEEFSRAQDAQGSGEEATGSLIAENSRKLLEEGLVRKRYDTRHATKPTYVEEKSDSIGEDYMSDEDDADYSDDEDEAEDDDGDSREDYEEKTPKKCQHTPVTNLPHETDNGIRYNADDDDYQQDQHVSSPAPYEFFSSKFENERSSGLDESNYRSGSDYDSIFNEDLTQSEGHITPSNAPVSLTFSAFEHNRTVVENPPPFSAHQYVNAQEPSFALPPAILPQTDQHWTDFSQQEWDHILAPPEFPDATTFSNSKSEQSQLNSPMEDPSQACNQAKPCFTYPGRTLGWNEIFLLDNVEADSQARSMRSL